MAITITDILSQYGTKYMNNGQAQGDILRSFRRTRTLPSFASKRFTTNDSLQLSAATIGNVLQPFHKTFSHKGNTTVVANEVRLRKIKIDQTISPDDIEESWLGFMADLKEGERANWPIVRYIWEVLVAERAQEDYEAADWAGEYSAAPGGGTAGGHLDIYDGLRKVIVDGLADSANPMHLLTVSEDPADDDKVFDTIEEIAGQLPQHWRNRQVDIYVPEIMHLEYVRDRRNQHGNDWGRNLQIDSAGEQPVTIDGRSNWRLVPFGGMDIAEDTGWIFATPRANVVHATKTASWRMAMGEEKREVSLMADWFEGVGILVNDMVYAVNGSGSA